MNKNMIGRLKIPPFDLPKIMDVNKTHPLTRVQCNNHSWPAISPTNSYVSFLTKPLSMCMWVLLAHFPLATLGAIIL